MQVEEVEEVEEEVVVVVAAVVLVREEVGGRAPEAIRRGTCSMPHRSCGESMKCAASAT